MDYSEIRTCYGLHCLGPEAERDAWLNTQRPPLELYRAAESDSPDRCDSFSNKQKQHREVDENMLPRKSRAESEPGVPQSRAESELGVLHRFAPTHNKMRLFGSDGMLAHGQDIKENTAICSLVTRAVPSTQFGGARPRTGRMPVAESSGHCTERPARESGGSSSSNAKCSQVEGDATTNGNPKSSLFDRRSPEEYSRIDNVESKLTTLLRQQASQDESQHMVVRSVVQALGKSLLDSGKSAPLQLRVHLPPYDDEDSVVIVLVPLTMRVAELHNELIRQHGESANITSTGTYEVRLYDEEECEPDYDSPPFDANLQIGSLNVSDVALCAAASNSVTPESPPLLSAGLAAGESPISTTLQDLHGILTHVSPQRERVSFDVSLDQQQRHHQEESPREKVGMRNPIRRAHSVPSVLLLDANQDDEHCTVDTLEPAEGTSGVYDMPTPCPDNPADGQTQKQEEIRPVRKTSDSEVELRSGMSEDCKRPALSHRRTRSTPEKYWQNIQLVTIGGFEDFKVNSNASQHEEAEAISEDGVHGRGCSASSITSACAIRQLKLLLPNSPAQMVAGVPTTTGVSGDFGGVSLGSDELCAEPLNTDGEFTVLNVREDATLTAVLHKLSQKCSRAYDPINFAIERLGDGIWQRLDLDMQVKHLQPHSNALKVVSKDVPGSNNKQLDSFRRQQSPSSFFFSENTASIVTEYLVTITARGSRMRPVECTLIVDRERLCHQPPRGIEFEKPDQKKGSFKPFLKKLGKHLQFVESLRTDPSIFCERLVRDIQSISCEASNHRAFSVVYSCVTGTTPETICMELVYQAQTPTECAEIVARLHFLLALVA